MADGNLLSFGPYLLDTDARRLERDGVEIRMSSRHLEILCLLGAALATLAAKRRLSLQFSSRGCFRH